MKIEIIQSIEKLLSYRTEWESILEEMNRDNVFLELDWIISRWEFLKDKHKLFTLIVTKDQEIIGICPLMASDKRICNEISFIGSRESSSNDFILRDKHRREALKCILDFMRDLKGKNIIKLNVLSVKSANYIMLKEYLNSNRVPYASSTIIRYFMSLKGKEFNTYFEDRFGNKARHTMSNKEKKLKGLGELAYKKASLDEIDEAFEIHNKRWLRKIGNSSFSIGGTKEFYKGLALNKNIRFKTNVDAITINNKIISFIYGFEYNGKISLMRIAHDDDFYFLSPGELVWKKKIEECFLSQMRVIDFGLGYEPYKAKWTDECEEVFTIVLPSDNLQSAIIFYIKYWVSLKLINAIKKNKRIYSFRKYYLGKLKFLFSKVHISNEVSKLKRAVEQNGLSKYIIKKFIDYTGKIFSNKRYLILSKYLKSAEISQGNLEVKEATIDDLDVLSEVMNESSSEIIRRLVNKHQCYITIYNNEIIHYSWINCSRIEISGVDLKLPLGKTDIHIYDTFMKRKYKNENIYMYTFSSIFNLLYKKNYKRCYITLDCCDKSLGNEIYKEIFSPKYKILEKRLFGTIKHDVIELS